MGINTGPIRLAVAGDTYTQSCRISKIIWTGMTTNADTVRVDDALNGGVLFPGTALHAATVSGGTHLSENWIKGLPAPNGFKLGQISAGVVYVYLEEA